MSVWLAVLLVGVGLGPGLASRLEIVTADNLLQASKSDSKDGWWSNAVFYNIDPRYYKDTDGNCTGDLKGIEEKVDHLKDMNVAAIVLPKIHKDDDFRDIDPGYNIGNLDNFKNMTKTLSKSNIKVIMEFDFASTPTYHPWFKSNPEYYFRTDKTNNWLNTRSGDAWKQNGSTSDYYLSIYGDYSAQLNLSNPDAKKEIDDILKFWMDNGVSGFKLTSCSYLAPSIKLENEKQLNESAPCRWYECFNHSVTTNTEEAMNIIQSWSDQVANATKKKGILMVEEPYFQIEEDVQKFVDHGANLVLKHIDLRYNKLDFDSWTYWIGNVTNRAWQADSCNFDQDSCNIITALLPGAYFPQAGAEIGSFNRAFKWDLTKFAGFTDNSTCGPYVTSPDYYDSNLYTEKRAQLSHYVIFNRLNKIRADIAKYDMTFLNVTSDDNPKGDQFFAFSRTSDTFKYIVLTYTGDVGQSVNLSRVGIKNNVLTVEVPSVNSAHKIGDSVDAQNISLLPGATLVFSHGSISQPISLTLLILSLARFLF